MRLIDADALLEVARNHLALFDSCPGQIGLTDKIRRDEIQNSIADILNAPTVADSPWHSVEEPPKEYGCYVVYRPYFPWTKAKYIWENGKNRWYSLNGEILCPTHWMPIEPPGEEV